jgi:hypothetical protein
MPVILQPPQYDPALDARRSEEHYMRLYITEVEKKNAALEAKLMELRDQRVLSIVIMMAGVMLMGVAVAMLALVASYSVHGG